MNPELPEDEGPVSHRAPAPRTVQAISALALVIVAIGSVAALSWASLVSGNDAAQAALLSIATAAVGALIVLAGGKVQ
jgi:hypothetical protein